MLIYNIGVDPWMNVAVKSIEENAKALGYEITVADGRNDVAQMSAAIDQFVIQGMNAIIVAPSDPDSLVGSVSKAIDAESPGHRLLHGPLSEDANRPHLSAPTRSRSARSRRKMAVKPLAAKATWR